MRSWAPHPTQLISLQVSSASMVAPRDVHFSGRAQRDQRHLGTAAHSSRRACQQGSGGNPGLCTFSARRSSPAIAPVGNFPATDPGAGFRCSPAVSARFTRDQVAGDTRGEPRRGSARVHLRGRQRARRRRGGRAARPPVAPALARADRRQAGRHWGRADPSARLISAVTRSRAAAAASPSQSYAASKCNATCRFRSNSHYRRCKCLLGGRFPGSTRPRRCVRPASAPRIG
ncbi:MAG: hypothetical protein RL385_941 [Pseudomonadota bacterium]